MIKRSTAWKIAPLIAAGAVAALGMYMAHVRARVHPFADFIGTNQPLRLTDTALHQRLLAKIPPEMPGSEVERALRQSLGTDYGRYCKRAAANDGALRCEFVLEEDLFWTRRKGLVLTVFTDQSGQVSSLSTSRFTRRVWD